MSYLLTKPNTLSTNNKSFNEIYCYADNNRGWVYRKYQKLLPSGLFDKTSIFTEEVLTTISALVSKIPNDVSNRVFTACEFFPKVNTNGTNKTVNLVVHSDIPLTVTGTPQVTIYNATTVGGSTANIVLSYSSTLSDASVGNLVFTSSTATLLANTTYYFGNLTNVALNGGTIFNTLLNQAIASLSTANVQQNTMHSR